MGALTAPLIQRQPDSADNLQEELDEQMQDADKPPGQMSSRLGPADGSYHETPNQLEEGEEGEMDEEAEEVEEEEEVVVFKQERDSDSGGAEDGERFCSEESGIGLRASRSRSAAAAQQRTVSTSPGDNQCQPTNNNCLNLTKPLHHLNRANSNQTIKKESTNNNNQQQHKQATSSTSSSTTSSNKLLDPQQMHICRLCDKLLSSSSSLDRHMLTHSGERPFVCKRCHMTFTTNGNMHRHMRTHLHKDSLARQQQEQQLKSLVAGAQVQQQQQQQPHQHQHQHQHQATNTINSTTSSITPNTTTSPSSNTPASSNSAQLAGSYNHYHPSHLAPLIGDSLARGSSVPLQSSSALALAAVTSNRLASALPFGNQRNGKQMPQQSVTEAATNGQQQSSVSALINQQLIAAFKQQQQQQHKFGLQPINELHDQVGEPLPASLMSLQPMAAESQQAAKYLHARQAQQHRLDPKSIMMGAMQDDQLGFESVKAVMLAAAAAAAAAAVSQQHQLEQPFSGDSQSKLQDEQQASEQMDLEMLQQQQRVRGKRRKQVNPRSTRANAATSSSLNSGDDADEDTDEEICQLESSQQINRSDKTSKTTTTNMIVKRARKNSSTISDHGDEKDFVHLTSSIKSNNDQETDDEETNMSDRNNLLAKQASQSEQLRIKQQAGNEQEAAEDFNNNQGEEFALEKVNVKCESNVDNDDDDDDEGDDDDIDEDEEDEGELRSAGDSMGGPRRHAGDEFAALRMNLTDMISDEENEEHDEDEASLGSDLNMNLSDNNNSSSSNQMSLTPFAGSLSSGRERLLQDRFNGQNSISNNATSNMIGHFPSNDQSNDANPINTNTINNNSDNDNKTIPITSIEGEIIEDISQSYVKTANPNAAKKGGKRNRHCYKCKLCTYSSVDRCTLVRHLRIHSGERPYICGICRYAFTTKANCERHVRKRHKKQYNSLGGAGGGGVKGSNGGGRSLIITDHSNHQTIPVKVNPVAAQTITQTLQRIQEKQQNSADDDEQLSVDNIERINNHQQQQQHDTNQQHRHHHHHHHVDIIRSNNIDTTSLSGYKQGKRKQRDDEQHPENQGVPYQRRRLVDKQQQHQDPSMCSVTTRAGVNRKSIERSQMTSANLMFNHQTSPFNQQQVPDVSTTNDLFASLVAQLQQVTNHQQQRHQHQEPNIIIRQDSDIPNLTAQLPETSPVPGSHLASATFLANMLAAGKAGLDPHHVDHIAGQPAQQQQSAAGLAGAQRSLLSSSKHLSQHYSQLRNLNSQTPLFIRRNPFDPFNPIDLAAQALDLSCKFQSK